MKLFNIGRYLRRICGYTGTAHITYWQGFNYRCNQIILDLGGGKEDKTRDGRIQPYNEVQRKLIF